MIQTTLVSTNEQNLTRIAEISDVQTEYDDLQENAA